MPQSIEFTELMAGAPSHGGDLTLAQSLRTAFITSDADDVATTADQQGDRITITSSGRPMTVRQVEAELDILVAGV